MIDEWFFSGPPALDAFLLDRFPSAFPPFLPVSSPLEFHTRTRRVVREIGIPAGRSVAQLQSPVACCRIRCTSVHVKGTNPPTSPVTFGIITVTRWFPFLFFLACSSFGLESFQGLRGSLLPSPPLLTPPPLGVFKAAMFLTSFLLCWMFMLSKQQVLSVSHTFTVLPRHGSWFSAQL